MEPLAHSAREGAAAQTYREHVGNVLFQAVELSENAAKYAPRGGNSLNVVVRSAAAFHDLGKLDEVFQDVLRRNGRTNRGFKHWDAGSAYLLNHQAGEAAAIAFFHHTGLGNYADQINNGKFRDYSEIEGFALRQKERTDEQMPHYLSEHNRLVTVVPVQQIKLETGFLRRLALSCLVDADHSDTARHYRQEKAGSSPALRAAERLKQLDDYVARLADVKIPMNDRERQRLQLRVEVYLACRNRQIRDDERVLACDSPVGTGKTTSVMAHLLHVAIKRGLRRIFVVLPFTNIIDQSVGVYRKALRLADESEAEMETVVAAHHHRVEFSTYEARCLAARWDAPVVVTTAVQFFETLAACDTSALRKLHNVAGSAIFIDEAHAAVPPALWPQMLRWLRELCMDWGCQLVLASGTLPRLWNCPGFLKEGERYDVPDLVNSETRAKTMSFEEKRVLIRTKTSAMSLESLGTFTQEKPGPRLVIFNTVQSAAVFANHLRNELALGLSVEHISTALTPRDRATTLGRVREHMVSGRADWTLVATSCVEAGVDFSFRTAFRESWGLVNLLQIAGRASRSGEYDGAEVWDFRHDAASGFSIHPQAKLSRRILERLFAECARQNRQPSPEDCTDALLREVQEDHGEKATRMEDVFRAEVERDYPLVAKLCRVIGAATQTVVVEPELIGRLENPDRNQWPGWREMMAGSVQLWAGKETEFRLPEIRGLPGVFRWNLEYDSFLGYMAGVLPLQRAGGNGFDTL